MTEIKALAIDLDGTLLAPDDSISARNRAAVEAAVAAGWHVVLATARWYQLAARTAHDLGLVDPVVACSGAEVRRLTDGTDLFDARLTPDFTADLYPLCDAADGLVFAYQEDDVVIRLPVAPDNLPPELRQIPMLAGHADPAPRGALVYGDELIAKVIADLQPAWRDDVRFLISMSRSGASILTITSARADKGLALAVACHDLGIDIGQVVAMGDRRPTSRCSRSPVPAWRWARPRRRCARQRRGRRRRTPTTASAAPSSTSWTGRGPGDDRAR